MHYVRRRPQDARRSLIKAAKSTDITLVLGAGVSAARGLPSWPGLVRKIWKSMDPAGKAPSWLESDDPLPHPLAYQILFEELEGALVAEFANADGCRPEDVPLEKAQRLLSEKIALHLYSYEQPSNSTSDTLSVLSALLRNQQAQANRRIRKVITFNVDDILERETNMGWSLGKKPVLHIVPRGSMHPRFDKCANDLPPINIFHLHGFVPSSSAYGRGAEDTLVFTDLQYWQSVSSPTSFTNRVMMSSLQESRCIFIGMSMTDVNITRWLGTRVDDFRTDRWSHYQYEKKPPYAARKKIREAMMRHYWITTKSSDPTGFIASHLERRGVTSVKIDDWGQPFQELMAQCFP